MTQKTVEDRPRGLARVVSLALRFRAFVLILFLLTSVALSLRLSGIRMEEDPVDSMIPRSHPFLETSREIEAMSERTDTLIGILEVKKGEVYNTETVKKVERITRELMAVERIIPRRILSLATGLNHYDNTADGLMGEPILGRISPVTEEDFLAVKRRVAVNPLGIGHVVSYDGTATLISAGITNLDTKAELSYDQLSGEEKKSLSLKQYKRKELDRFHQELLALVARMKAREEDPNHILHFTGDRLLAAELTSMARTQVPTAAAAMMVVMLVLLIGYLKSFRWALVPVFAFALSVLWGLGLLGVSGFLLNPAAFLLPLLLGIVSLTGSAIAVREHHESDAPGESRVRQVAATYRSVPVAASVVAAGLVILAMLVTDVPMIRQAGWLGLFWAVGTFVVVVLVCPVLMSLIRRPAETGEGLPGGVYGSLAARLIRVARGSGRRGIAFLLALILVAGGLCAWKLEVGGNVPGPAYVRPAHPWRQGFDLIAERFNGPHTLLVHVRAKEEGGLLDPEAINQMGDLSTYLKAEGIARESLAFDWVVKMARLALMDGNPKWWTVPASKRDMAMLSRLLTFSGELDVLVDEPFNQATVASFFDGSDADQIDRYVSAIRRYVDTHPSERLDFSLGGGLLATTKMINDGTRSAYRKTLAVALAAVFLVCLFFLRSLSSSLAVTLSVAAGQALTLTLMTLLGWPVGMAAVPAGVIGAGFGALLGIPWARRLEDAAPSAAAGEGLSTRAQTRAGGGILFLGFLAFAGTLPWFFIGMKFQSDMAVVTGITFLLQAVSAVVFVPALTATFRKA